MGNTLWSAISAGRFAVFEATFHGLLLFVRRSRARVRLNGMNPDTRMRS